MENENNTTGDSELDAIIYGEDAASYNKATPTKADPSTSKTWEAGGRKWDSPDKLAKSYDALVRDYSKTKNSLKELQPWGEFGKFLDNNPQLREELKKKVDEYQQARNAGATQGQAQKEAGLPKEFVEKIERLEAAHSTLLLEREMDSLRNKYKLDDDQMREVLKCSEENDGIALDKAYKLVSYEKQMLQAKENGAKGAQASAAQKKAANVGSSANPAVAPNSKAASKMSAQEHNSKLAQRLDELGFKD